MQDKQTENNSLNDVVALITPWSDLNYYKNGNDKPLATSDSDTKIKSQILSYVII